TTSAAENRQATDRSIEGQVVNASTGTPESGVWVIAETSSLQTRFRKIVVTNDGGRFLVPELPTGDYTVWVRGYGLRDSSPVHALPGEQLVQRVAPARDAREAAQVYPANYWLSLYEPPSKAERPPEFSLQAHWLSDMKLGCIRCHQLGSMLFHARTSAE